MADLTPRHPNARRALSEPAKVDCQWAVIVAVLQRAQPVSYPCRQYAELGTLRQLLPALQLRRGCETHQHSPNRFRSGRQIQLHWRRTLMQQKRFAVKDPRHGFAALAQLPDLGQ